MKRQIALAYAIASLATAIAVFAVVGSMVGWSDQDDLAAPPAVRADAVTQRVPAAPVAASPEPAPAEEVVYVDETGAPLLGPPTRRHREDHDRYDEDDDDDHHRRGHHREYDDDDDDD